MKYVKILGLLAVAAAALMAFAASASADTVTTTTSGGTQETPTIHATNEGGHVSLQNPIATISCSSTVTGTVTSHEAGKPVVGSISELLFTGCTNSWHVTAVAGSLGKLSFEASNGELKSSGTEVDTTKLGVTCVYETAAGGAKVGTVTGGSPATPGCRHRSQHSDQRSRKQRPLRQRQCQMGRQLHHDRTVCIWITTSPDDASSREELTYPRGRLQAAALLMRDRRVP